MENEERTDALIVLRHGANESTLAIENFIDYTDSKSCEDSTNDKPVVRERTKNS